MKPNPHHYTQVSDVCADDGVGCDGYEYDAQGGNATACDCPCHGDHAPVFETNDDVREWHK